MSQLKDIKLSKPITEDIVPSTKQKVKLTPFRVGDEKVLLMASESKDAKQMIIALKTVVSNCVEGVDVDTLPTFDLEYLFLKLRAISVGETSTVGISCQSCSKSNIIPISLDTVEVEFDPKHKSLVKLSDDLAFQMKYITLDEAADFDESNSEALIGTIAKAVDKVYYGDEIIQITENELEDLKAMIENLTTKQFKGVEEFFETAPKLRKKIEFTCGECQHENHQVVEGLANFF